MGYASQVIIFYGSISYIVILAWAFLYFFSSLSGELPWATCNNTWNTGELVICLQALSVLAHAPLTITAFVWSVYTFSFSIYNHLQKTVCKKWNIMCDNWNLPKLIHGHVVLIIEHAFTVLTVFNYILICFRFLCCFEHL